MSAKSCGDRESQVAAAGTVCELGGQRRLVRADWPVFNSSEMDEVDTSGDRIANALLNQLHHDDGSHNLLAEPGLLQELEGAQRRAGIGEELGVLRLLPVLQVVEIGDELRLL
jgi:hypothetical protein